MRVRFRSRASWSMPLRACSIAAAAAEPAFGTWLRRTAGGLGGVAGSVFVVIRGPLVSMGQTKDPRLPGEGPFGLRGPWRLALVPPRPSVLPPGAGNEPKKALKPEERAKLRKDRYVGAGALDRHMDAATVRRDDDGDGAGVL